MATTIKDIAEKYRFCVCGSYFHRSIKKRYRGYREALEIHNFEISRIEKYGYRKNIETSRSVGEAGAACLLEAYPEIDAILDHHPGLQGGKGIHCRMDADTHHQQGIELSIDDHASGETGRTKIG